ncbi:DUF3429 domain-containing protein [Pannonibacter phragmitetus]|uniref:DUF3429 domain-containing protein n=1 Tax=Pannonibacter phragmitetus TaxID=121719 RepID=A0A0U3P9Z6_9HYPH|nr:DUF3429 domain-containing protein [Pannonibacter phragmitetus]ALV25683.1 hypothetical protein APZ00_00170 [Pannonibacter phragmitetus]
MTRHLTFNPLTVPRPALALGVAGLIPFAAASLMTFAGPPELRPQAAFALAAYGAVILSFLGGIHWGVAMAASTGQDGPFEEGDLLTRLAIAVAPSLAGWAGLLLPQTSGLLLLAACFAAMFALDLTASREGKFPLWYPALRLPLSAGAAASVLLGAAAPSVM